VLAKEKFQLRAREIAQAACKIRPFTAHPMSGVDFSEENAPKERQKNRTRSQIKHASKDSLSPSDGRRPG